MVSHRFKVLAFTRYGSLAASSRQRLEQFLPLFAHNGIEIEISPLLDDAQVQRIAENRPKSRRAILAAYLTRLAALLFRRDYDAIWVQYEFFPWLPGALERLGSLARKPIIVDMDDAIFHQYRSGKLEPLLRSASLCICGNRYIRAYASRFCRTTIIPTVLDTEQWKPRPTSEFVIGWIGSPSTWPYVEPFLPVIRAAAERHGATFRTIGAGPEALKHDWIDARPWSLETEIAEVQAMSVGIMPVPDTPWTRGKCGYKLIQYMACGAPVIASPVGMNTEIVTHGREGFLAATPADWTVALDRLLSEPELRRALGEAGRTRIEQQYSAAVQAPRLLAAVHAAIPEMAFHVPGVPAVVQTHPRVPAAEGALFQTISPRA